MKKIALLFLILTLFYNVLGYYVMFADKQEQAWVSAMEKIDDSKFEVIKLNINPYAYIEDSGFEYVNKDMVVNHKTYHVFKNRILKNVLHLYCLKNSNQNVVSKDLKNALNNQLFDSSSKENPAKKLLKCFQKDFISNDDFCFDINIKKASDTIKIIFMPQKALLSGYFTTNYPPPDFV
jgi:hypothetical protein